ncbi:hypothetical protein BD779DRAFT_1676681 [Infundibulicybe gibba]|nr:hypothetical protein BD779DRAFT_1676681 [Infundibulicybe gibba]
MQESLPGSFRAGEDPALALPSFLTTRDKYQDFVGPLDAGLTKINEYYERTGESEAYTFVMLLDPSQKQEHIQKYWGEALLCKTLKQAEETYKARHLDMYDKLLRPPSDDEGEVCEIPASTAQDTSKPWLEGFHSYLDTKDRVGELPIIEWWGYNAD